MDDDAHQAKSKKEDRLLGLDFRALAHNRGVLSFFRVYIAVVAGAATGVLGTFGWHGFLYYFAAHLLGTFILMAKTGGNVKLYFDSWSTLWLSNAFTTMTLMTFMLVWMVFYNLAHIF